MPMNISSPSTIQHSTSSCTQNTCQNTNTITRMPSTKTRLSNCYTPLPEKVPSLKINTSSRSSGAIAIQNNDTTSHNTRTSSSLRRVYISRHILSSSTGSSLIEIGHTKVLCAVHGPRSVASSSLGGQSGIASEGSSQDSGSLNCEIRHAPFGVMPEIQRMTCPMNLDGYSSASNLMQIETELSSRLHDTLKPSIPLHLLKKNVVDVFVMVLQDDGGVFAASVAAASLALADAGVECYDLVSCFTVAVVPKSICFQSDDNDETHDEVGDYHLLADPSEKEILLSKGIITLAMMKSWKDVVFWNQTGSLPPEVAMNALEMAKEGCTVMYKLMRQALLQEDESHPVDQNLM